MKSTITILLLSFLATGVFAQASHGDKMQRILKKYCDSSEILLTVRTDAEDRTFVYLVTKEQYGASPSWDGNTPPPMSQIDAIKLGKELLAKRDQQADNIALLSITLHRLGVNEGPKKWYYAISYDKKLADDRPALSWEMYLLMDGTEVRPIEYTEEK